MWHEDGDVILRSTEYDVIASGETLDKALLAFVRNTLEYTALLREHGTEADRQIVQMIYERLGQIFATIEMQEPHGLAPRIRARRRGHGWHLQHHAARI
jgi:hypothetical protein